MWGKTRLRGPFLISPPSSPPSACLRERRVVDLELCEVPRDAQPDVHAHSQHRRRRRSAAHDGRAATRPGGRGAAGASSCAASRRALGRRSRCGSSSRRRCSRSRVGLGSGRCGCCRCDACRVASAELDLPLDLAQLCVERGPQLGARLLVPDEVGQHVVREHLEEEDRVVLLLDLQRGGRGEGERKKYEGRAVRLPPQSHATHVRGLPLGLGHLLLRKHGGGGRSGHVGGGDGVVLALAAPRASRALVERLEAVAHAAVQRALRLLEACPQPLREATHGEPCGEGRARAASLGPAAGCHATLDGLEVRRLLREGQGQGRRE